MANRTRWDLTLYRERASQVFSGVQDRFAPEASIIEIGGGDPFEESLPFGAEAKSNILVDSGRVGSPVGRRKLRFEFCFVANRH